MNLNFEFMLIAISIFASSASVLIAFELVKRLYLSTAASKKAMLPVYAIAVGLAVWANHFLVTLGFHPDAKLVSPGIALIGLFFSLIIGYGLLYVATQNYAKISRFALVGLLSGVCDLGLFYCSSNALHGVNTIQFHTSLTILATFTSCVITTIVTMLFYWIKTYSGKHSAFIKIATAISIATGILAIHIIFEAAIAHKAELINHTIDQSKNQLTGITIGLGMITLFMLLLIFTLLFEKHGKQLFKISFLDRRENAEQQSNSMLDSLTKLPNRRAFQQHIDSAAKRSGRAGTTFALAYIDLDHFKPINDQHGHHVGDIVLSKVADRLNASVRGCDFVARIGGDEFVAIIEEIKSNDDISPIVARIVSSIKEPFAINQLNIEISCSVGIAIYPQDGDLEKLMVCADAAMYKAKEGGKNQYKYYDTDIEQASEELLALQSELCLAIENNEFTLAYQPKIDCQTNLPIGAEALIRWNHPTKGELPPKAFIQAAERFGLINEINSWVVDECCRTIAEAKRAGFKLNFSVNLSSHQFRNPNLVKDILKTLKFYDLDASSLSFEIKETLAINNQSQFKEILEKFSEAGINVVLDDFGLHPISLAYLQNLHVSEIKLDKSFINNITQDKNSKALIDAVIKLAHALDLQVVAEGVETELQRDLIVALGCDYMQGYLFSKAITAEQLFKLYTHLHNRQFQLGFETSGQLLVSDYQLGEVA